MAKPTVEKAPDFDISVLDVNKITPFIKEYNSTDDKGRYLHWDRLKWRVPREDAKDIWQTVKFKRTLQMKYVNLLDDKGSIFSYCTPHSMEAKLHQVANVAGGSVASIANNIAPDSIQRKFLVSSLIMEEAITSSQLEGAATTREVAKKMLEEGRNPIDDDERMILNNFFLLKHAERTRDRELTVDLILEFHIIATRGSNENSVVPGEFRLDNDIFVEDDRGEIAHQPPSFELIPDRLTRLCSFANKDHSGVSGNDFIAPVIKAIILHFMLGYEHPFRDGNGRTARALFYWYMLKNEYDLFKYVSISKLLKEDPKGYGLSYMYTEKDQNDLTYFIDYQLGIVLSAFDDLQQYLKDKTDEFYQVMDTLEESQFKNILNFIQKDIIKKGTKEPGRLFTVKEISSSYEISENTARSHLNALVEFNLLLKTKDGRKILYFSPSNLYERLRSNKA
jgi:Fic family protein